MPSSGDLDIDISSPRRGSASSMCLNCHPMSSQKAALILNTGFAIKSNPNGSKYDASCDGVLSTFVDRPCDINSCVEFGIVTGRFVGAHPPLFVSFIPVSSNRCLQVDEWTRPFAQHALLTLSFSGQLLRYNGIHKSPCTPGTPLLGGCTVQYRARDVWPL